MDHRRSNDGATGHMRSIADHTVASRKSMDCCGVTQSRTEDQGAPWSACLFNDLFFIARFFINRYMNIDIGRKAAKFIELSGSFPNNNNNNNNTSSLVTILTETSKGTFILKIKLCKTIGFLKSTILFRSI